MIFDPVTKALYTDQGQLIKRLRCPYIMQWDTLEDLGTSERQCNKCNHHILDTAFFTEAELLQMIQLHPDTCLKIDLFQQNVTIQHYAILGKKKS